MTLRKMLLRAYPRQWRQEYGAELEEILAHSRITPRLAMDVLASAIGQRFLAATPWKICFAGLMTWYFLLRNLPITHSSHPRSVGVLLVGELLVAGAGTWTALRHRAGMRAATLAGMKAASANGIVLLIGCVNMLHAWGTTAVVQGHTTCYWIPYNIVITAALSAILAFAGAALGHSLLFLRRSTAR